MAMYCVTAWVVLQLAEVTFEPLGLPDWAMRAVVLAAIAGVPIAFLLAWIIDIRPEGLIFDVPFWTAGGKRIRPARKSDLLYALLLVGSLMGGSFLAVDLLLDDFTETAAMTDAAPAEPQESAQPEAPPNSIAVLAFDNFDGNPDSDYFAAGLAEEILNLLAAVPELRVAARTSSFRFRDQQLDVREVARLLMVRHVLAGSVRRVGQTMRVATQLIDGAAGYQDWSESYDRELNEIFQVQEEIAAAVVNELSIALSLQTQPFEPDRPTDNVEVLSQGAPSQGR